MHFFIFKKNPNFCFLAQLNFIHFYLYFSGLKRFHDNYAENSIIKIQLNLE